MPARPTDDELAARWVSWLELLIDLAQVIQLRRTVINALDDELVRRHVGQATSLVVGQVLRPMYFEAQTIGLRRLTVDSTRGSRSLLRLLDQVRLNPQVLSRERYIAAVTTEQREQAEQSFDQIAGDGEPFIPVTVIDNYRRRLREDFDPLAQWTHRYVAHKRRGGNRPRHVGAARPGDRQSG